MSKSRFEPMLAADAPQDLSKINYPVLASVKLDGVRAVVRGGVVYSRNLKPIVNEEIQRKFGRPEFNGFDGELIDGPPTAKDVFSRTQSVTKKNGKSAALTVFYVFDQICDGFQQPFHLRYKALEQAVKDSQWPGVTVVKHERIETAVRLGVSEESAVLAGWEGVMVRSLDGPYKFGRSTEREGYLMKVKRFAHDEAEVLGVFEQEENTNEQTADELGRSKRSSKKAGKVGKGTLGGFRVRMVTGKFKGVELNVGTGDGWTDEKRKEWWDLWTSLSKSNAGHLPSKVWRESFGLLRVKHQPVGAKDAPRFPIGSGWRDPKELGL